MRHVVFLLYHVLVLKFHVLFSIWYDSVMKRQSKDSEKQTRHFSDWFPVPVPSKPCSHMLPREHSSLPQPTAISLLSQQGIAFPVLTLILAWIINCLMLLSGFHVCRDHTGLGSSLDSAASWLCGHGKWLNLSETQFPRLLNEDNFATYFIRLSGSHHA